MKIDRLPFPKNEFRTDDWSNIEFAAWEYADILVSTGGAKQVSDEILAHYCLGYYTGQVNNGGHSQLTYNMDIDLKRSEFLMNGVIFGLNMIGASDFIPIARKYDQWLTKYPGDAAQQTGFSGGRASYLDQLDEEFFRLNKINNAGKDIIRSRCKSTTQISYINRRLNQEYVYLIPVLTEVWLMQAQILDYVEDDLVDEKYLEMVSNF